jgi:hypothetical protein
MLIAAAAAIVAAVGCGGSSSAATAFNCPKNKAAKNPSSEPSAEFNTKGENGQIVTYGEEADAEEREAASCVLEVSLEAREDAKFPKQCETLSAAAIKRLAQESKSEGLPGNCASTLASSARPLEQTALFRKNTMTGPIAALRVKGNVGYALYHGSEGKDYAVEMEKDGDEWRVARLATTELP